MASKWISVKGIARWAKVYTPDAFMGAENYKIDFAPIDALEQKKLDDSGIQLTAKKNDEDGLDYIRLRRPVKKVFSDEVTFFAPPEISGKVTVQYQDENGDRLRQYKKGDKINRVGDPVEIGNGSTVIANICVYDTVKGKGHRLEGLTVLDLVEYKRDEQKEENSKELAERQVEERFGKTKIEAKVKEEKKTISEDLNDKLPW